MSAKPKAQAHDNDTDYKQEGRGPAILHKLKKTRFKQRGSSGGGSGEGVGESCRESGGESVVESGGLSGGWAGGLGAHDHDHGLTHDN